VSGINDLGARVMFEILFLGFASTALLRLSKDVYPAQTSFCCDSPEAISCTRTNFGVVISYAAILKSS
jgi:hypothetical protein